MRAALVFPPFLQGFWGDMAEEFHWNKRWEAPFSRYNINLNNGPVSIEWFIGAQTNVVSGAHTPATLKDDPKPWP